MKKPMTGSSTMTRRDFIQGTAGVVATTSSPMSSVTHAPTIRSAVRREDTLLRLGGDGDNWHMSWAADDRQFVALSDGMGWSKDPKELYNNRLYTVSGGPHDAKFLDLPGYPQKAHREKINTDGKPGYYGFGTLAIDGRVYQFLSNMFRAVKVIYSPDNGLTWRNQDGSTPVVWEDLEKQSSDNMAFFEEPQQAFSLLSVLQMGRNYEHNRDGYVYVYAPNGTTDGTMNELVMFRVPKTQVHNRRAYEFYAGTSARPAWTRDINSRSVVHTFPRGWVNKTLHPYAWHPSLAYNAPLNVYMMANWGMGCAPDGEWFGKPSYLGLWIAPKPWGPWTQVHEETAWTPGHDHAARAYQPQIAPKWIAADGKSFWLVWTDFQHTCELWPTIDKAYEAKNHDGFLQLMLKSRDYRPYYSFNTQRVDLIL